MLQPLKEITTTSKGRKKISHTSVTRYIYDCFEHLPHGRKLQPLEMAADSLAKHTELVAEQKDGQPRIKYRRQTDIPQFSAADIDRLRVGDTISIFRDDECVSNWDREEARGFNDVDRWFALIMNIKCNWVGYKEFDVLWYYRPVETTCGLMQYPHGNELFLSDHCSCRQKRKIVAHEILAVHDVDFGGNEDTTKEFFCRQLYTPDDRAWVSLRPEHFACKHIGGVTIPERQAGNTYLVTLNAFDELTEPCQLICSTQEDCDKGFRMRRLFRRREVDPAAADAPPNELVYSEKFVFIPARRIISPCKVRTFLEQEDICTPYDRDGTACCFFITHQMVTGQPADFVRITQVPESFQQGYSPEEMARTTKLRGLDLFCGGGNFGRGLEDAGFMQYRWANDLNPDAMRTYMANVQPGANVKPFVGSIDDLIARTMKDKPAMNIPSIGDVDFISGGSPCQGFSSLTNDKTADIQLKNQSMVAAFASCVDLYRPKYGILENVPGIIQTSQRRGQDVCSQLICALVGMGYQLRLCYMKAYSFGASQNRGRIFIMFARAGLKLPDPPLKSHTGPEKGNNRSFGRLPTGEAMIQPDDETPLPFQFRSAREACSNLPSVYDGKVDICVPFPDHRIAYGMTRLTQQRLARIPTYPYGVNFSKAYYGEPGEHGAAPVIPKSDGVLFSDTLDDHSKEIALKVGRTSNMLGRMYPDRPMETIITKCCPVDGKNGRSLHWEEPRPITLMEARRAQGFRDEEVILGNPTEAYRIVGNSVCREVALALGVAFRDAYTTRVVVSESLKRRHESMSTEEAE